MSLPNTGDWERDVAALIERVGDDLADGRYPMAMLNNPDLYPTELRRIFGHAWNYLGHVSEFTEPGDYARRYIGEDPFILTRDESGELHAFLDSCMHRGAQFCTAESGNTSHFRCPYHGWTYKNDGTLQGMPHMAEAYQDLDEEEIALTEAHIDSYRGLIFGRIADEGPTLREYLGEFTWYLDVLFGATSEGMTVVGEPHRWEADHDWKTSADNFSGDSYHVLTTHQAGLETETLARGPWEKLDDFPGASYLACTDRHSVGYYLSQEEGTFMGYPDSIRDTLNPALSDEQRELFSRSVFHFGTVFPNMSIIHGIQSGGWGGPWACIRKWNPRGPGTTETTSWWLVPTELADDEGFLEDSHRGWESLSPGGAFESDDLTIWEGISDSSGAVTHELRETRGNMQQGLGAMSDEVETVEDPLHGPAAVTSKGLYFDERNSQTLLRSWYEMMRQGAPES
ncbi:Rieske 2Fe-2S domain-containing protein [Haloarcula sp. S1CR25-12]|uniref:Rieske 2Fe-2S domain-containing protein n=1 Tax=Haloarcula saliterrae TaxID=2950534 RepID=A0ABU2FFW1_9EURY|nr:Rieske 2Fe-2S domain-containing protein [Haloarcula sp. S1CR25-12]MDS0261124.1 Rieske 2Fe-2S domain-containing protein [Haloarcula sp. S1CR25-12]